MTDNSGPPFRADHVGSLLRPAELLRVRAEREAGRASSEELRRVEDDAVRDVARMQHEIGLAGVTDGEFRRGSWHMDFLYRIGGVGRIDQRVRLQFRNEAGAVEAALGGFRIGGKLRLDETIFDEDFAYLKSVAPAGTTPKLTIPSPSMLHYRGGRAAIDAAVYTDIEEFWHDLARVYAREIAALHRLGCSLSAARRYQPCLSERPGAARLCRRHRRRRRDAAPDQHQGHQRGPRRPASRHDDHDPYVPRQFPFVVDGRRRL